MKRFVTVLATVALVIGWSARPVAGQFFVADPINDHPYEDDFEELYAVLATDLNSLFEVTKEGTRPGNQDFYAWIKARGHSEFWKTTVWAKKEIEKEKVFEGMRRMMKKLDDGEVTVDEAKAHIQESDEKFFTVGRRGSIYMG